VIILFDVTFFSWSLVLAGEYWRAG